MVREPGLKKMPRTTAAGVGTHRLRCLRNAAMSAKPLTWLPVSTAAPPSPPSGSLVARLRTLTVRCTPTHLAHALATPPGRTKDRFGARAGPQWAAWVRGSGGGSAAVEGRR